jgi:hypothetical protein
MALRRHRDGITEPTEFLSSIGVTCHDVCLDTRGRQWHTSLATQYQVVAQAILAAAGTTNDVAGDSRTGRPFDSN